MIHLRSSVNSKGIPEKENPIKIIDLVEKIINFSKELKGRGRPSDLNLRLKIITPKQILQRLPIALAQVKAGNTSENFLNEICKTIYSLYQAKK